MRISDWSSDVCSSDLVMVSTAGFSRAAKSQLLWEGIKHMTISPTEAKGLRWIPHIEQWFGLDRWFRETTGVLFEAMRVRNVSPFLDTDIPYEEWVATIQRSEEHTSALQSLMRIAY